MAAAKRGNENRYDARNHLHGRRAFVQKFAAYTAATLLTACGGATSEAASTPFTPKPVMPSLTTVSTTTVSTTMPVREAAIAAPTATSAIATNTIALGTYVDSAPEYPRFLDQFVALAGFKPAILMWYRNWKNGPNPAFTPKDLDLAYANDAVPMITWQPLDGSISGSKSGKQPAYSCANIADGQHDDFITTWARAAAKYRKVFFLRFAHEMNGGWYPWGTAPNNTNGNTSEEYVAMWQHVVDIFRREGATNVRWVWSPNASSSGQPLTPLTNVYPEDDYVDWVGIDGYNFGTSQKGSKWIDLRATIGKTYQELDEFTDKPVMIAEIACAEQGGSKAAWITQGLLTDLPMFFPRVRAVIWFNADREANWRIDSSQDVLAAFQSVAQSPLYQTRLSGASASAMLSLANSRTTTVPAFQQLWSSTDAEANGHTYVWGPAPFTDGQHELYDGAMRTVQYFDKGRMELKTNMVTAGLLTQELITGKQQTGGTTFLQRAPAHVPVAGDADNTFPTYANLAKLQKAEPNNVAAATLITKLYKPDGTFAALNLKGDVLATTAGYDAQTRHNIPSAFVDFRNMPGVGSLGVIGLAITEPVWANVKVRRKSVPVLIQGFERRILTYTPSNPPGFRVECGNIGRAYYQWRYGITSL